MLMSLSGNEIKMLLDAFEYKYGEGYDDKSTDAARVAGGASLSSGCCEGGRR